MKSWKWNRKKEKVSYFRHLTCSGPENTFWKMRARIIIPEMETGRQGGHSEKTSVPKAALETHVFSLRNERVIQRSPVNSGLPSRRRRCFKRFWARSIFVIEPGVWCCLIENTIFWNEDRSAVSISMKLHACMGLVRRYILKKFG